MSARKRAASKYRKTSAADRSSRGAVLPLVAFLLFVGFAFVGFSTDVMRSAYASSYVRYGAEAAALGSFSAMLSDPGQSYDAATAQANIISAIGSASAWNTAPYGPDTSSSGFTSVQSAVHFDGSDITFVNNPNSADNDFFLQLRGRRDGNDSLTLFFLPLLYAFNGGGVQPTLPAGVSQAHPQRVIEVVAQPATRIGAGAPRSANDVRSKQLAGFTSFPLAISLRQFAAIADPSNSSAQKIYTIDIGGSQNNSAPISGHILGALVNVTPSGSNLNYYGDVSGNLGINQLTNNLNYFGAAPSVNEIPSAVVESGSLLPAFDTSSTIFQQNQQAVVAQFSKLAVQRSYIFPVLAADPVYGSTNKVVGFARLRVLSWPKLATGAMAVAVQLEESIVLPNASFANGARSVPDSFGPMPAPTAPFTARTLTADGLGLSTRPRAIVMAPSLSPRYPIAN